MLLPETDQRGAIKLAQRLRASIEGLKITDNRGNPISVTASVGLATIYEAPNDLDAIIKLIR